MAFDKYFGFDLTQRQTLKKLLEDVQAGALTPEEQQAVDDLVDNLDEILAAATLVDSLPTTAQAAGIVWNNNGVLTVELT